MSLRTKATYSWSGDKKSQQLGFMENDTIEVLKIVDNETFYGESVRTKERGFFPSNYIDCDLIKDGLNRLKPSSPKKKNNISNSNSSSSLLTLKRREKSSSTLSETTDETDTSMLTKDTSFLTFDHNIGNKFTSSYVQQVLNSSTQSTETNVSSVFGHSDLSATSAGSYIRHKEDYDTKLFNMKSSSSNYTTQTRNALNDILDKHDKKSKSKLFPSFLRSRSNDEPTFDDRLYLSSVEKMSQLTFADSLLTSDSRSSSATTLKHTSSSPSLSDFERTKTITGTERALRAKRVLREQPDLILKPQTSISDVNYEKRNNFNNNRKYSLDMIDYSKLDEIMGKTDHGVYDIPETFATKTIAKRYKTPLERARAIYIYLTRTFTLRHHPNETLSTKRMFQPEKTNEIMQTCVCTPHQLTWFFYIMATAVGLEVEMILGYLKHPFALNETITDSKKKLILNHSWLSICIDDEYRFIDVILGNPTNDLAYENNDIWDIHSIREFYFLAKPFQVLKTHTPHHIDQQLIVPPIDVVAQLSLPPMYPHAEISAISLYKYNSCVFHLKDYELYDFELEIPYDYDIVAEFRPYDREFEKCSSFVQIYQRKEKRIAHFQGIMSRNCPAGFICVTGKSEFSKKWNLLLSIPCFHKGKWRDLSWVTTVSGINGVDAYIKEPKVKTLTQGKQYFDVRLHVTEEVENELIKLHKNGTKIGLFNPDRGVVDIPYNNGKLQGTVDLDQPGSWVLGVLDISKKRWKFVAEWDVI